MSHLIFRMTFLNEYGIEQGIIYQLHILLLLLIPFGQCLSPMTNVHYENIPIRDSPPTTPPHAGAVCRGAGWEARGHGGTVPDMLNI